MSHGDDLLAIVNPAAGGGRCGRSARKVLPELCSRGLKIEIRETAAAGDATHIAADAWREGYRRFIAVGGDGTAFEVANGIVPPGIAGDETPALGILPLGTGNSFVSDFAKDGAAHSIDALIRGESRPSDLIHLEHASGDLYALGTVSLAFPADVAALVNRRLKSLGRLGYSLGVVACVAALAPLRLRIAIDDDPATDIETVLLCIQNNRNTGGNMLIAPEAEIDDGNLDLVLAGPVSRLELLRTFPKIFKGTHTDHPAVTLRRHRHVAFHDAEVFDAMIDGESLRIAPERVAVVTGALEIIL